MEGFPQDYKNKALISCTTPYRNLLEILLNIQCAYYLNSHRQEAKTTSF